MMPHSNFGIRTRTRKTVSWRDMRYAKIVDRAHQKAHEENKYREERKVAKDEK